MTLLETPPLADGVLPRPRPHFVDPVVEVGTTVGLAVLLDLVIQVQVPTDPGVADAQLSEQ